ncbi:MAG: hemolysin family protein [Pseudomonadota bacterium]|nr:hemolysin family protein [Pseudomonadota bacterium]
MSSSNAWLLLFALFLVLLNGFFVAAEFAIVKLRHTRVAELSRLHGVRGRLLATVHRNLDSYLSACQLGITLASLGLGWIGEPAFAHLLELPLQALGFDDDPETVHQIAFVVAFATISYLHIVLGELAPKSAALRKPEAMSLWTAAPLFLFYWAMYPFIWVLNDSANRVLRLFGLVTESGHDHETPYTLDELRMILRMSHSASEPQTPQVSEMNRMLAHTLELPQLHASDVMHHFRDLICIGTGDNAEEVRRHLQTHRYSRYPYIDTVTGEILGVLHYKDIAFEIDGPGYDARLRRHLLPLERVSEDFQISTLLRQFRLGAPHLAIVEDEEHQVVGFVTMEDVLEAIFGEIVDEHEPGRKLRNRREPQRMDDGSMLVRGDTPLFMLERELGVEVPESKTLSTVAGLLMERLGHVPQVGDEVDIADYRARVLRIKGSAIEAVSLTLRVED